MTAVSPAMTWTARKARNAGAVEPTSSPRMRLAMVIGGSLLRCPISISSITTYEDYLIGCIAWTEGLK
jgi:hypothetical protein